MNLTRQQIDNGWGGYGKQSDELKVNSFCVIDVDEDDGSYVTSFDLSKMF